MKFKVGDIVKRIDGKNSDGINTIHEGDIGRIVNIGVDGFLDIDVNGKVVRGNAPYRVKLYEDSLYPGINFGYGITKPYTSVKQVIFNPPATIILWNDNTKSVVKCQDGEPYDAEKGFALAYLKKLLGNDNTFNKEIHKWVKDVNKPLTIKELMKMDGKKVYVVSLDRNGKEDHKLEFTGWRTVSVSDKCLYRDQYYYRFNSMNQPFGYHAYLTER